jgi:uncharacterized membrane protein YbhN (UPF0104 family)
LRSLNPALTDRGNHACVRPIRALPAAAGALAVLAVAASSPELLGSRVRAALHALGAADPRWLWLAGVGFSLSLVGAAGTWRCAIALCGGRIGLGDAAARFGAGSLVNTFVPARAGDAVRLALFSRTLEGERLWRAGGAFAAIEAARAAVLAALVVVGAAVGALPLWPLLLALGGIAAAIAVAFAVRGREAHSRAAHLLDAFRALGADPRAALRLVAWAAASYAPLLLAATAVGAALGIARPLVAALVIVPALAAASLFPLTPGNLGVTSGAVAMAFAAHGISFTHGLAAGFAFQAVESAVGLSFGLAGVAWLARYPSPAVRRLVLLAGSAAALAAALGGLGATVLLPLV